MPFKIYTDFECILRSCNVGSDNDCFSYTKKYQDHVSCSFANKVICTDDKFSKDIAVFKFINMIL